MGRHKTGSKWKREQQQWMANEEQHLIWEQDRRE